MSTLRVAIVGATGYTGEELIRLLLQHPHVQITYVAASAKWDRPTPVSQVYPRFARTLDLTLEALDPSRLIQSCDAAFLALPHGAAMNLAPKLLQAGKRVVDLSGDFRLSDPSLYPAWYEFQHTHPELLNGRQVAYGLTEYHHDQIRTAALVANPGCYATGILLACLPLFEQKLVKDGRLLVDAKSGFSGAGRKPELASELKENFRPYKVNHHQHMPEVLQEIQRVAGTTPKMGFTPQVLPVVRGLLSNLYINTGADAEALTSAYAARYTAATTPFVRIRPGILPQFRDVVETNYCDIGFVHDAALGYATIGSAIDNLTKGAAGQAIQNLNVMYGFPQTAALN